VTWKSQYWVIAVSLCRPDIVHVWTAHLVFGGSEAAAVYAQSTASLAEFIGLKIGIEQTVVVIRVKPFPVWHVHATIRIYESVCLYDPDFLPAMDTNFARKRAIDLSVSPLPMLLKAANDIMVFAFLPFVVHSSNHKWENNPKKRAPIGFPR
jgi:hypothetical protein